MKLLCVVPSYWPAFQFGGPIYSVHNLNKALVNKGVNVTVYTTNVGLDDGNVPINEEVNVDGVKVFYFKFIKFFEFLGTTGWQFSPQITKKLRENLKNFDIIYINAIWNYPTAVASYYCRKYSKPYILSPRGSLYPSTFMKKAWKKSLYYNLIARNILEGAKAIHYTTEDEAQQCHQFLRLNNKAIIIPNGLDLSEFNDLPNYESLRKKFPNLQNKKVILFLSRINWIKGMDILIEGFAKLKKEKKDVHLLIVGKDDGDNYIEKVKLWVKRYNLENFVTFAGQLTGKDKLVAYCGSDIFILPSYSENFGMVVIEAMACELPVIISDKVGLANEIKKNNAGIIIGTTADDVYRGLKTTLENQKVIDIMKKNAKKMVYELYDINRVADRMIEFFKEILINGK